MRKWKYAVAFAEVSPMTAPLPLAGDLYENMRKAASMGYDGIEIHAREYYTYDVEKINEVSRECGTGMAVIVTGRLYTQGGYSLLNDDPAKVEAALNGLRSYIDSAEKLGVGIILGWAKGNVPEGADRDEQLELLASRMKIVNDYGKAHGVPIYIEVINRYEVNIFRTCRETVDFIEAHDLDNCFVHLDTFHMNIEETDPYEAIRTAGSKLRHVHVADNTRLYPGSGTIDFKKILAALDEINYTDYVSVECFPVPDRDTAAKKAIEHLIACEPK